MIYIANARIPSEKAHPLQVMKMSEAFSFRNIDLHLIIPYRHQTKYMKRVTDIWGYYGIERNCFNIKKVPCIDLLSFSTNYSNDVQFSIFLLQALSFSLFAAVNCFFKNGVFYTRDPYSALVLSYFKKNVFLELHTLTRIGYAATSRATGIIALTKHLKNKLVDCGINREKILVAPDGVDLQKFNLSLGKEEACNLLNLPIEGKIVTYTGHLFSWKGIDILIETAKILPDINFLIVGGTESDQKKYREKIHVKSIKNVSIIGHYPPSIIPQFLKAADILVLPNSGKEKISCYYTSPLKMFEYMAAARPIVATDLPSLREILNEENAILVKPDDPKALAEGIKVALEDKELAKRISEKAFEDVQQYSWEKRAERIARFIEAILEK